MNDDHEEDVANKHSKSIESTFLVNMKPLRDLAQIWDMDIASCLQDYLTELAQVGHPVPHAALPPSLTMLQVEGSEETTATDAGKTNFAQAALILQNSSFVYSRKVEYLYSLVYAALNELIANSKSASTSKNDSTNKKQSAKCNLDKDLEEFENFDSQMEFLLLDDVLPTDEKGDKINLKSSTGYTAAASGESSYTYRYPSLTDSSRYPHTLDRHDRTRLSLNTMTRTSLDTPPGTKDLSMSISHMGTERSFVDMVTGAGLSDGWGISGPEALKYSITAKATLDAITNAACYSHNGTGGGNASGTHEVSLRLLHGACDIDDQGTLLIPGSSIPSMYEGYTSRLEDRNTLHSRLVLAAAAAETTTSDKFLAQNHEDYDFGGGGYGAYDDDNDDSVHGPVSQVNNNESSAALPNKDMQSSPRHLRSRNKLDQETQPQGRQHVPDPWLMMDPHDPGLSKPCRLRIGMTYKLPSGVKSLPSESVTGARTKTAIKISSKRGHKQPTTNHSLAEEKVNTVDYVSIATFHTVLANCERFLHDPTSRDSTDHTVAMDAATPNMEPYSLPKEGLIFGDEFSYIIEAKNKTLQEQLKQSNNKTKGKAHMVQSIDDNENNNIENLDQDNDTGGGFGYGMDYGGDYDDADDHDVPMDEDHVNVSLHRFDEVFGSENVQSMDDKHQYLSFQELCQAHLNQLKEGAERFAVETKLSKRVSIWQERLATILDEEEKRPEFEIQSYGQNILSKVQSAIVPSKAKVCLHLCLSLKNFAVNTLTLMLASISSYLVTSNCGIFQNCF